MKKKTCTRATLEFDSREVPAYPKFTLCSLKWAHDVPSEFQGGLNSYIWIKPAEQTCPASLSELFFLYIPSQDHLHYQTTHPFRTPPRAKTTVVSKNTQHFLASPCQDNRHFWQFSGLSAFQRLCSTTPESALLSGSPNR